MEKNGVHLELDLESKEIGPVDTYNKNALDASKKNKEVKNIVVKYGLICKEKLNHTQQGVPVTRKT